MFHCCLGKGIGFFSWFSLKKIMPEEITISAAPSKVLMDGTSLKK